MAVAAGACATVGTAVIALAPSTVVLAVVRGLLMDLDATGDDTRTSQAFQDFLATLPRT